MCRGAAFATTLPLVFVREFVGNVLQFVHLCRLYSDVEFDKQGGQRRPIKLNALFIEQAALLTLGSCGVVLDVKLRKTRKRLPCSLHELLVRK